MKRSCPICKNESKFLANGLVAPWIAILFGSKESQEIKTTLQSCEGCSLSFFSYRYNPEEVKSLYENYRSEYWYQLRNSYEPWYRKSTNNAYVGDSNKIAIRKSYTENLLLNAGVQISQINDYLDYGGDNGQFFPSEIKGKKYLFDIQSGFEGDIQRISSTSELSSLVDVVANCYVLEHVADINLTMSEMKQCLKSEGHLLVELPYDKFRVSKFHKTRLYEKYLHFIYKRKALFIALDFITGLHRQFFNMIPFYGVVKQSEHINYFDLSSLQKLVERFDFRVVSKSDLNRRSYVGLIKQGKFGLVSQRK